MWFWMISLMRVQNKAWNKNMNSLRKNVPDTLVLITSFTITKFNHLFLVIINYIFQLSIKISQMQFCKNQVSVLYVFLWSEYIHLCLLLFFEALINFKAVSQHSKGICSRPKRSPVPFVIFWGGEFGGRAKQLLISTENRLLAWLQRCLPCLVIRHSNVSAWSYAILCGDNTQYFKYFSHFIKVMNFPRNLKFITDTVNINSYLFQYLFLCNMAQEFKGKIQYFYV